MANQCNSHAENVNTHTDTCTCTCVHIVYNFFHLFLFRQIRVQTSQLITLILTPRELAAFATTYRCEFCSVFKPKRQITHCIRLCMTVWEWVMDFYERCTHTKLKKKKKQAVVFYYQHYFHFRRQCLSYFLKRISSKPILPHCEELGEIYLTKL